MYKHNKSEAGQEILHNSADGITNQQITSDADVWFPDKRWLSDSLHRIPKADVGAEINAAAICDSASLFSIRALKVTAKNYAKIKANVSPILIEFEKAARTQLPLNSIPIKSPLLL